MHVATHTAPEWMCENLTLSTRPQSTDKLIAIPNLNSFLLSQTRAVELYDLNNSRLVHRFETGPILSQSLQCLYMPRKHLQTGFLALGSLTLAYIEKDTENLCLDTYIPVEEHVTICFFDPGSSDVAPRCHWEGARAISRQVQNPGAWVTLPCGAIVGIRKTCYHNRCSPAQDHSRPSPLTDGLRRRTFGSPDNTRIPQYSSSKNKIHLPSGNANDDWEVWMMSNLGSENPTEDSTALCPEDDGHLFVSDLGPITNIGTESLVMALGNVIKVISVAQGSVAGNDNLEPNFHTRPRRKGKRSHAN